MYSRNMGDTCILNQNSLIIELNCEAFKLRTLCWSDFSNSGCFHKSIGSAAYLANEKGNNIVSDIGSSVFTSFK